MGIAIVTDSTCDLPSEIVKSRNIHVVPQYILWGTESFKDGIQLPSDQFYERLGTDKVLPKTSQPSPGDFAEAYRAAKEAVNAECVVCITLSADLSGTHNSAIQAVNTVDFPVHVVDARTASLPLGYVVLSAATARDAGASAEEIVQVAQTTKEKVQIYFTVANLEFLQRGGRIGAAKRFIGDTLKIRPILYVENGKVGVKESVRTRSRGLKRLVELVEEAQEGHSLKHVGVIHGLAHEEAHELAATAKERFKLEDVIVTTCCSAVGTHVGPGVIGIVYELN